MGVPDQPAAPEDVIRRALEMYEGYWPSPDLCTVCESQLHRDALILWPDKERQRMEGIVRG